MNLKELYLHGIDYDKYLNSKGVSEKEKSEKIYNDIVLTEEEVKEIEAVKEKVNILAFAEVWCPDCIVSVPALKKLNDINSLIEFSVVGREGNEEYLEEYKEDNKAKIPTFLIMDEEFKVKGAFIERPKSIKEIEKSGDQVKIIVEKRNYRAGKYINATIKEILDIIKNS